MDRSATDENHDIWPSSADPLGEALHFLHMDSVLYSRSEMTAPWGLAIPYFANCFICHIVISGQGWLEIDGREPTLLRMGDFALVPSGSGHRVSSSLDVTPIDLFDAPRKMVSERYELLRLDGGGEPSGMICVVVRFDHPAAHRLIRLLPKSIIIESWQSTHFEWIQSSLRLMAHEAQALHPGGETVITRLADILVIQAIRSWLAADPSAQTGWLGALKDKQIGQAILLIQQDPARQWTVETLAQEVAMSRSAFAARFKRLVGETPMQYLTSWRMDVALGWLQERDESVGEIGEQLGYQSEAAFSRAFKRAIGQSPGAVRRNGKTDLMGMPV